MPRVTDITPQKRRPNRRNVYLDGRFAFACHLNVVAKFRLRPGLELSAAQIRAIESGELKQECFDRAMVYLTQRLHSQCELARKLKRQDWPAPIVEQTLDDLARLGYIDDERFARAKAAHSARRKSLGPRRAVTELLKAGIASDLAARCATETYADDKAIEIARQLAARQSAKLRRLDPSVARRRLSAYLQRRGFDYDCIRKILSESLGSDRDDTGEDWI